MNRIVEKQKIRAIRKELDAYFLQLELKQHADSQIAERECRKFQTAGILRKIRKRT